jgi:hypothetical protein
LIEGFAAPPNGEPGRLFHSLPLAIARRWRSSPSFESDMARTCSAGKAARPTSASTARGGRLVPLAGAVQQLQTSPAQVRRGLPLMATAHQEPSHRFATPWGVQRRE